MLGELGQRCGGDIVPEIQREVEMVLSGSPRQNQEEAEVGGLWAPTLGGNLHMCRVLPRNTGVPSMTGYIPWGKPKWRECWIILYPLSAKQL